MGKAEETAVKAWEATKKILLDKMPFNMVVYDAINAAVPITIDGNVLILGISNEQLHQKGLLDTPDQRNVIEATLSQLFKREFTYEVIAGTTLDDYRLVKERRAQAAEVAQRKASEEIQKRGVRRSIDAVTGEIQQRYSRVEYRQFPQHQARFLRDCLPLLVSTLDELEESGQAGSDEVERQLARLYDKLSVWTNMPAAVIALEVERLREQTKVKEDA